MFIDFILCPSIYCAAWLKSIIETFAIPCGLIVIISLWATIKTNCGSSSSNSCSRNWMCDDNIECHQQPVYLSLADKIMPKLMDQIILSTLDWLPLLYNICGLHARTIKSKQKLAYANIENYIVYNGLDETIQLKKRSDPFTSLVNKLIRCGISNANTNLSYQWFTFVCSFVCVCVRER